MSICTIESLGKFNLTGQSKHVQHLLLEGPFNKCPTIKQAAGNEYKRGHHFVLNNWRPENHDAICCNPDSIDNIMSMSDANRKGHVVTCTLMCLDVINPITKKYMAFDVNENGLYTYTVPDSDAPLLQSVEENEKLFTPRQIAQARKARNLYQTTGHPSYIVCLVKLKTAM
jgi:hypothetical protein